MPKTKCAVLMNETIWLITMKMRMKMINRSHSYNIKRTRSRPGYKYTKYRMCLSMVMFMCLCALCVYHLKLNSWKIKKTLRLDWKKSCLRKSMNFSLHDGYHPFLYTAQAIFINWDERWFSKSNILTMGYKLVLENFCTMAVGIRDYCFGHYKCCGNDCLYFLKA